MSTHSQLSGYELHDAFNFIQEADPGAVGANLYWLKISTGIVKRRSADNTSWIIISPGTTVFTGLADVPNSYTGQSGKFLQVNGGATGLQFATALTDPTTTKGDLIIRNSSVLQRLGVGSDGQVLTADSTQTGGIKWGTGGGGGSGDMVLISGQKLSSTTSSITFSSIPGTYTHLQLICHGASNSIGSGDFENALVSFNGDSTSGNYMSAYGYYGSSSGSNTDLPRVLGTLGTSASVTGGPTAGSFSCMLPGYSDTIFRKSWQSISTSYRNSSGKFAISTVGSWLNTSAITSIVITPQYGSNWITGSIFSLYGING
jgi:hypothetical protein